MKPNRLERLYTTYKEVTEEYGEDASTHFLREVFSQAWNIDLFGQFFFGQYTTLKTPHFHKQILKIVQQPGNKAFAAPRGHGKTTVIGMEYVIWLIVNDYKHFIIIVSDVLDQSKAFLNILREEIENNDLLKAVYGSLRGTVWNETEFETTNDVRVEASAYGRKIRGKRYKKWRPDLLILDDLENDEAVESALQRKKLRKWFTRAALRSGAKGWDVIYIGTILHHDSLLKNIIDKKGEFAGWSSHLFKALNVDPDTNEEYALWPELYSVDELKAMRDDPNHPNYMGSIVFAQEYQNEPRSDEDAIIKGEWIGFADRLPDKIKARAVAVDPAISKEQTADYTAKIAAAEDYDGNIYIYEIGNDRHSFLEGVQDMALWYWRHRPLEGWFKYGIEDLAFQQAFKAVLPPDMKVEALKPDKDKVRRTLAYSYIFEAKKVYIIKGIKNAEVLFDQLTQFPLGAHDDLVDATIYAIAMLKGKKTQLRIR